jgi:hypothetical protein
MEPRAWTSLVDKMQIQHAVKSDSTHSQRVQRVTGQRRIKKELKPIKEKNSVRREIFYGNIVICLYYRSSVV